MNASPLAALGQDELVHSWTCQVGCLPFPLTAKYINVFNVLYHVRASSQKDTNINVCHAQKICTMLKHSNMNRWLESKLSSKQGDFCRSDLFCCRSRAEKLQKKVHQFILCSDSVMGFLSLSVGMIM